MAIFWFLEVGLCALGYAGNREDMVGYRSTGTIMVIASPTT